MSEDVQQVIDGLTEACVQLERGFYACSVCQTEWHRDTKAGDPTHAHDCALRQAADLLAQQAQYESVWRQGEGRTMSEGVQQVIEKLRKAEIPTLGLMWQAADLLAQQAERIQEILVKDSAKTREINILVPEVRAAEARADALAAREKELEGAIAAQDEREQQAGVACGIPYEEHGCDWPDAVAERIVHLRAKVHELESRPQLSDVDIQTYGEAFVRASGHIAELEAKLQEQQEEIERLKADVTRWRSVGEHYERAWEREVQPQIRAAESSLASLRARIGELEQEMREWWNPKDQPCERFAHHPMADDRDGCDQCGYSEQAHLMRKWADQLAALLASSGVLSEQVNHE